MVMENNSLTLLFKFLKVCCTRDSILIVDHEVASYDEPLRSQMGVL